MKHIVFIALLISLFSSCHSDDSAVILADIKLPSEFVESSFIVKIIDINGIAIEDSEVVLAGETKQSNDLGYVQFEDVNLDRYGSLLTAEKSGYFKGLRRLMVHAETSSYVELTLLSDLPTHSFMATNATVIENEHGVRLNFDANSIVTESGESFEGNVHVAVQYIDPTARNISSLLPGSLQGVRSGGTLASLKSYSMIAVELTNDEGQALQIKEDKTVQIEFPVPDKLLKNAPTQIPLWYLDEHSGQWIEEGYAVLTDLMYRGTVSHFSYWNCDIPEELAIIEGTVCNMTGGTCQPLSYSNIDILDSDGEIRIVSRTDSYGNFIVTVPKNVEFTIDFITYCKGENDQLKLGPFTENQDLGQLEINAEITEVFIQATVTNCDGSILTDGVLLINDHVYVPIENGIATTSISDCDESNITFQAFSQDFSTGSGLSSLAFSTDITATLSLCEEGLQEDLISVIVTNNEDGSRFSELVYGAKLTSCIESETDQTSPNGSISTEKLFISHLNRPSTAREDHSKGAFIEFFNGPTCDVMTSDVVITYAFARLTLSDGNYSFRMKNLDLRDGEIADFELNGESMTSSELTSFGVKGGDIIEGKIYGENIRLVIMDELGRARYDLNDNGTRYSVAIRFRVTVED